MKNQTRIYPASCTSAYCGRLECPFDCQNLPRLKEFKAWVEQTGAVVLDEVWCPLAYTAQREVTP